MDKKLINHKKYVEEEIKKSKLGLKNSSSKTETSSIINNLKLLNKYNNEMIRNFQHERFIHLIVTFFFAFLLIGSIVLLFSISLNPEICSYSLLCILSTIISLILLVTELFYIRHYYLLENNTEKLYDSTREIFLILKNHQ